MPMVKALVAVAVTVTEAPRLTEEPFIVIALLVSEAFAMLVSVFVDPLIETPLKVTSVPPSATMSEPIVIELFVSALFGRFMNVFTEPLIDLLLSVCELSVSTSVLLAGIVVPFSVVVELLVSVVNAPVAAVVAPTVVPLIAPPVIATAFAFWMDIVPKPVMSELGIVAEAVNGLVPLPMR